MKKTRRSAEQTIRILSEADTGLRGGGHPPHAQRKLPGLLPLEKQVRRHGQGGAANPFLSRSNPHRVNLEKTGI